MVSLLSRKSFHWSLSIFEKYREKKSFVVRKNALSVSLTVNVNLTFVLRYL